MIFKLIINDLSDLEAYLAKKDSEKLKAITPSPLLADQFRDYFQQIKLETITVSAFCQNLITEFLPAYAEKLKSKSELILLLRAASKNFEQTDFNSFKQDFNLFTSIRSYSTDEVILDAATAFYDKSTQKRLKIFHQVFESLDILDEHRVYSILKDNIQLMTVKESLLFAGFDYMNSMQVDFMNSLGESVDIYIPIYKLSYDKKSNLDWVTWLEGEDVILADKNYSFKVSSCYEIPEKSLSLAIKELNCKEKSSLVLAERNISFERLAEVSLDDYKIKIPLDFFEGVLKNIKQKILEQVEFPIATKNFTETMKKLGEDSLRSDNFLSFKIYCSIIRTAQEWEDLSDLCVVIDLADFMVIFEVIALDLPRINYAELSFKQDCISVYSLSDIEFIKNERLNLIFMENFNFSRSGNNQIEDVEKYLASIGPIRRSEFDFINTKAKIYSFLNNNNVGLILENDLLKRSSELNELIENTQLKSSYLPLDFSIKENRIVIEKTAPHTIFSATKLQTYFDCPRKYYFQYHQRIKKNIELSSEISPLELGKIEHKLIERYYKEGRKDLALILDEEYKSLTKNKNLISFKKDHYLNEILHYATNGIDMLKTLGFQYSFEVNFSQKENSGEFTGQVDCLGDDKETKLILDFKRSNYTFTSFSAVESFEKIQLWFYLRRLITKKIIDLNQSMVIGYLDLSVPENSMLFCNDQEIYKDIKERTLFKVKYLKNFNELVSEYEKIEGECISNIKNEKEYIANPRKETVCDFCDFSSICDKGFEL